MSEVYRNSLLGDSFDHIDIEAFSKGSVLVDYYVYFKNFEEQVSTSDLKIVLNQQLEDPLGQTMLGRFMVDPGYTDFIGKDIAFHHKLSHNISPPQLWPTKFLLRLLRTRTLEASLTGL